MKRLGLIGVGAWGRRYVDRIRERTDCSIVAIARASARRDVTIEGTKICEDWQSLVRCAAAGELDGAIAATTPQHQAEVAAACAAAGVPLLVEKPLGLSHAQARLVRERFEQSARKAPLIVDYVHLWAPAYVELKRRVAAAGGTASIAAISSQGYNRGPLRSWPSLYDYGPHDLSMALGLSGADAVFRLREAQRVEVDVAGHALYDVRFELGGVPVHMRVGNGGAAKARRFAVALHGGRELVYEDTRPHPHKLIDGDSPVAVTEEGPLDAVLSSFLRAIERFTAGEPAAADTRECLVLSESINTILDEISAAVTSASEG